MWWCARLLVLPVLASVACVHASYTSLREQYQYTCNSGYYGSPAGTAQRLVVTHLAPGIADWNVVVPMPPTCRHARVTGVETVVCDADEPPDVTMLDWMRARVHRRGQRKGYASVNVTVHCLTNLDTTLTPRTHNTETRSTYEILSNELTSKEIMSNEEISDEVESKGLTTSEIMPSVVMPTSSTAPSHEDTTPQPELVVSTEPVTSPPKIPTHSKEVTPQSLNVIIEISPVRHKFPNRVKPKSKEAYQSSSEVKSSQKHDTSIQPRNLEMVSQHPQTESRHHHDSVPAPPPPHAPWRHPGEAVLLAPPQVYMRPPLLDMLPAPYLTPLVRPLALLQPRTTFWHRPTPFMLLRHY